MSKQHQSCFDKIYELINNQIQNVEQTQQTNDILELKNMLKSLLEKMDSMLNIFSVLVAKNVQ